METSQLHNISEISAETLTNPDVTAEQLAILKLKESIHSTNGEFSEISGSSSRRGSFSKSVDGGQSSMARSSSRARSSRQVSSSIRRTTSARQFDGHKFSMELNRQAEGKFFALMDLVANASREAASLKEVWSSMIQERDSLAREREELTEQVTEISETLEQKDNDHHHHNHAHAERKQQVDRLLLELSTALNTISEHKRDRVEHENELARTRGELQSLHDSISRTSSTQKKAKVEFEALVLRLSTAEDERDQAKRSRDQKEDGIRTLTRENTDLKSQSLETSIKLETTRKEVYTLVDRLKTSELERETYLVEKERLQELLHKANTKNDETSTELFDMTERHQHQVREVTKFKNTIRELESDNDSLTSTIDHLRRDIKIKSAATEEVEARIIEITVKLEQVKRENHLTKEKLTSLELERIEHLAIIEKNREDSRLTILERDQLKDDMESWRHRHGDAQRLITAFKESLRKSESTLSEVNIEVSTLTDRLSVAERERGAGRTKHDHQALEIEQLKEKLIIIQTELHTITHARDSAYAELQDSQAQYEELTETMTEIQDNSGGYEFELKNMRTLLIESRDQKERAIAARTAADRERDEYIVRYEDKCRELERFEQDAASQFHAEARSGGRTITSRVVTRSGITGSNHHESHSEEVEEDL